MLLRMYVFCENRIWKGPDFVKGVNKMSFKLLPQNHVAVLTIGKPWLILCSTPQSSLFAFLFYSGMWRCVVC
jgi:hypothetical protein